jgi:transcriptional regulator with XRE-family HTH domain
MGATMANLDTSLLDPEQRLALALVEADYGLIKKLRRIRRDKGISLPEMAERLGVSVDAVTRFEMVSSEHNLSSIRRYAAALNVLITHTVTEQEGTGS